MLPHPIWHMPWANLFPNLTLSSCTNINHADPILVAVKPKLVGVVWSAPSQTLPQKTCVRWVNAFNCGTALCSASLFLPDWFLADWQALVHTDSCNPISILPSTAIQSAVLSDQPIRCPLTPALLIGGIDHPVSSLSPIIIQALQFSVNRLS